VTAVPVDNPHFAYVDRIEAIPVHRHVVAAELLEMPGCEAMNATLGRRFAEAWTAWIVAHGSESREQWIETGLVRARANLTSNDPTLQALAVDRLSSSRRDRRSVIAALRQYCSRTDVSDDARGWCQVMAHDFHVAVGSAPRMGRPHEATP
jgi:hypothetical protein